MGQSGIICLSPGCAYLGRTAEPLHAREQRVGRGRVRLRWHCIQHRAVFNRLVAAALRVYAWFAAVVLLLILCYTMPFGCFVQCHCYYKQARCLRGISSTRPLPTAPSGGPRARIQFCTYAHDAA